MKTSHFNSLLKELSDSALFIVSILLVPAYALSWHEAQPFTLDAVSTSGGWGNCYLHFTEEDNEVREVRLFSQASLQGGSLFRKMIPRNGQGLGGSENREIRKTCPRMWGWPGWYFGQLGLGSTGDPGEVTWNVPQNCLLRHRRGDLCSRFCPVGQRMLWQLITSLHFQVCALWWLIFWC